MILGESMLGSNDYLGSVCAKPAALPVVEEGRKNSSGLFDHEAAWDGRLSELLGFESVVVEGVLRKSLLEPVGALISNRGKRVRAQLVSLAYRLVHAEGMASLSAAKQCRACAEAIELIHAGSLIVDDIEDGSQMRRGKPSVHVQYGMPLALNAGNWLYFWPFEVLRGSGLSRAQVLSVYEHYHRTLLRAHFGQAIDLGSKVNYLPQASVTEVCLASTRLKTGALTGFAAVLGGAVAGAAEPVLTLLDEFGADLGVALQMFDDLGNVISKCDPLKRYEDLALSRPSWVWACAATRSNAYEYEAFLEAVARLPDAAWLERWFGAHGLIEATRASAREHLEGAFARLERGLVTSQVTWSVRALNELRQLGDEIAVAYE
jgi:geranylgeranyl pyrophosphate synthase